MQYMRMATTIAALAAMAAAPAAAQGRSHRNSNHIPPGQRPPAGMCRIWIDGVPPGQQPAPTDCATAAARRPANSRIIYGDGVRDRDASQNGSIFFPNSRRTSTNQNCFQQLDRNGQMRTMCRDRDDDEVDDDRGIRAGDRRDDERGFDRESREHEDHGKGRKGHKGRGDGDRDD